MSYESNDLSEQDGKPAELYLFTVGASTYTYTSGDLTVRINFPDSNTDYVPLEIERTTIEQSKELARASLEISMPRDAFIPSLFVSGVPTNFVGMSILRMHSDGDYRNYWTGRVRSVEWKESIAILHCDPLLALLKRAGLRAQWGPTCQHALYDGGCTMDRANFLTTITLTDVGVDSDGNGLLTGSGEIAAKSDDTWFPSGYAQAADGQIRFIVAQTGDTVSILQSFVGVGIGDSVDLYAGCAHDIQTCHDKFVDGDHPDGNEANFFAFHVNPVKNPFVTGLD